MPVRGLAHRFAKVVDGWNTPCVQDEPRLPPPFPPLPMFPLLPPSPPQAAAAAMAANASHRTFKPID